jgi:hypothetical protein
MPKKSKAGRATGQSDQVQSTAGDRPVQRRKPTQMQKNFAKNFVETGKVGKSALKAGYSNASHGSSLMKTEAVQTAIQQEMFNQGITDTLLSKKMKDGLGANYPAKFSAKTGQLLQEEAPDFYTRKQYIDMILKIRGDYAPEKHQIEKKEIVIILNAEVVKGLKDAKAITDVEAEVLEAELVQE